MEYTPNYKKIFHDMILNKYPEKEFLCRNILNKEKITTLDVVELNKIISERDHDILEANQKFKSYDLETTFRILEYQKKYGLNNSQTARHFNLSRNTIAKWKKLYFSTVSK